MEHYLFAIYVTFGAAALQGIIGFGSGLISMGMLSMLMPVSMATAVLCPLGCLISGSLTLQHRAHLQLKSISPLLWGIPLGIILGLLTLESLSETLLKGLLGIALLASVINRLVGSTTIPQLHPSVGVLMGTLAGITGTAFSASGPPVLIFANLSGWSRDHFRANLSFVFWFCGILAIIGLSLRGVITLETLYLSATLCPGVLFGSFLGARLGNLIPQRLFQQLALLLLTLLALRFLYGVLA